MTAQVGKGEAEEQRALINSSRNIPRALSDRAALPEGSGCWAVSCTSGGDGVCGLGFGVWGLGFGGDLCPIGSPQGLKGEFAELVSELCWSISADWHLGQLTRGWAVPG